MHERLRRHLHWAAWCWLAIGVVIGVVGCGDGGLATVTVSGVVYLDDQPLNGVIVSFVSPKGHLGTGRTDASGRYRLHQGAVAGPNQVFFQMAQDRWQHGGETDYGQLEARAADAPEAASSRPAGLLPARYSDPSNAAVTFRVPEQGTDQADFHLTSR